jgi:hypothetical protein
MSTVNSKLKNWLKRNGFKGEGKPLRACNGYIERDNRKFRIRGNLVDVGDLDFDRWANSKERTIELSDFKIEFKKNKE